MSKQMSEKLLSSVSDNKDDVSTKGTSDMKLKTRYEHFMAKLAGFSDARDLTPKTRWELFIGKILGREDSMWIEPKTRDEKSLNWFASGKSNDPIVYGFRVDSSESDPNDCISYLEAAVGMEPAAMDFVGDTWSYGDWENAFFMPRPCMLKYDGTVDYYLDPSDYSKKVDGSASDIADVNYGGNAMMEWGRDGHQIWYKIVPDDGTETSANIYIANMRIDDDYHAWSFINNQGNLVDHFYTPIYNGSIDSGGRLRSISGANYHSYCKGLTAAQEIAAAEANNPGEDALWYTETFADITLIQLLTVLITKSLDAQGKIGVGLCDLGKGASESSMLTTGSMNDKGLFWGSGNTDGVKCFGMENFWGNQLRRYAGLVYNSGYKYKLTMGTEDGSSGGTYNTTGTGYIDSGFTGINEFINGQSYNGNAMFPTVPYTGDDPSWSGSYCSGAYTGDNGYAYRGGAVADSSAVCGLFYLYLDDDAGSCSWDIGAAPSCKPLFQRGGSGGDTSTPAISSK